MIFRYVSLGQQKAAFLPQEHYRWTDSTTIPASSADVNASPTSIDSSFAAPVKAGGPATPAVADPVETDEFKAWVRANVRWLMAELDWTRSGRTAEERETLNP